MPVIDLFVIGFNRPDLLREQHRLLSKYMRDEWTLAVVDNSTGTWPVVMADAARGLGVRYMRSPSPKGEHHEALNFAARCANEEKSRFWGVLDHDVFPSASCDLVEKIKIAGFLGLGQTYSPRVGDPLRYVWPGWCFFSRTWLKGRIPNFDGIRGKFKFDDGDTGSMLHTLFTPRDWESLPAVDHGYGTIRPDDGHGLQSFGYERMDSFVHLTNSSGWKAVPNPQERELLLRAMVAAL